MDTLTARERSERMSRIKGKNTKPELAVRRLVHRMGYRYRLHGQGLPGKPDLVFAGRRKVVFVHGCFWHRHEGCRLARLPKSKLDFWLPKLEANAARDKEAERKLVELGWKVLVIWECEVKDEPALAHRVRAFLDDTENNNEGG
ncbi:very short patch repair endonuclease [Burkholderia thailandensis]|uniref:very short patch repair endonuclease n=1 Tax=Burkholderia thailandensis TaxID=57975 RepID=UPI00046CB210|nr:very short patch repair endonuclease [Burkholderia thailandensis]AWY57532.1 very short patch repair endonuclease [Burkholderia thailandensis]AWY68301.1 very short patch repair endonuclease [Burkholderia thailandensis]MCS6495828.1 very short patch repair endonuclease [Burkholderia thailandensis]